MAFSLSSIPKRIHRTLGNLQTGIILLILVVLASAVGTFILQRPVTEPDKLARAYSPATLRLLDRLTLTDVFHAWWFLTLMGLVSLSIIVISVDRFPNAWRFYARPYRKTDSYFRAALQNKIEFPINNPEEGLQAAERALKITAGPVEHIADRTEASLYSERHRFSVMAVYIVHASLLLIFAGGIIDGVFGYRGYMELQKGQTSNAIELRTGGVKQLPFSIRCTSAGRTTPMCSCTHLLLMHSPSAHALTFCSCTHLLPMRSPSPHALTFCSHNHHALTFCSSTHLLLMHSPSAHALTFCSCTHLLPMRSPSPHALTFCSHNHHALTFCSCTHLLLMHSPSAHALTFCSCTHLLLMHSPSAHALTFCSSTHLLLMHSPSVMHSPSAQDHLLLMHSPSAHALGFCSCTHLLLMHSPSAHALTFCSCTHLLRMHSPSAHALTF